MTTPSTPRHQLKHYTSNSSQAGVKHLLKWALLKNIIYGEFWKKIAYVALLNKEDHFLFCLFRHFTCRPDVEISLLLCPLEKFPGSLLCMLQRKLLGQVSNLRYENFLYSH
jgi:hypothetical protein